MVEVLGDGGGQKEDGSDAWLWWLKDDVGAGGVWRRLWLLLLLVEPRMVVVV